jgi:phosphonatase-like hydrolase
VLDSVGTMVPLEGLFETALVEALSEVGVNAGDAGSPTRSACLHALAACPTPAMLGLFLGDDRRASWAHQVFETALTVALERGDAEPIAGADATLDRLVNAGIGVCFTTALRPELSRGFIEALGWSQMIDVVIPASPGLRRPPYPDTVLTAMLRIGVDAVHQVAVVGDTVADLVAGTSAGASMVIGVLGGAHAVQELTLAPHTHLLGSIAELPDVLPI